MDQTTDATLRMTAVSRSHSQVMSYCVTVFCFLTIRASGSGITIFNDVTGPLNLSFAIDESIPTSLVYNKAICSSPPYCHNIAIYDKQTLTNDNHILDIMIFPYENVPSHFAFNGAIVRTATAAVAPRAILSYSPTAVPPSQRSQ
jgi:hypothetical protein